MSQDILQSLINGVAVTFGLFVLWSFVGKMRELAPATRFQYALIAGVVSAAFAYVVRMFV
jgi:hypothetical protein